MMFDIREHARAWLVGMAYLLALMLALRAAAARVGATLDLASGPDLARDADVGLAASEARIEAASGALLQAGASPNPSIGVDVENFPRSNLQVPFHRTEATLYYQRILERGDKREARTNAARADLEAVRLRRIVRALDLFQTVETAWNEAVARKSPCASPRSSLQRCRSSRARSGAASKRRAIRCSPAREWTPR